MGIWGIYSIRNIKRKSERIPCVLELWLAEKSLRRWESKKMKEVPKSLRTWFFIHFLVDLLFSIPLFLFPLLVLNLINIQADPLAARIIAAALFAIGTTSLLEKKKGMESYQSLLTLKIIWSSVALLALLIGILQTKNVLLFPAFAIFLFFNVLWVYYKRRISRE